MSKVATPLERVNRLNMFELQEMRINVRQNMRANAAKSKIHKRAFATSPTRIELGRDVRGNLIGSGILFNQGY